MLSVLTCIYNVYCFDRLTTFQKRRERTVRHLLLKTNECIIVVKVISCSPGMMVGGYMWGYLADQRGRRRVLVVSLTINGLFGGLASMAPWFWLFLLMRFISGIGWVHGLHIFTCFRYMFSFSWQPHIDWSMFRCLARSYGNQQVKVCILTTPQCCFIRNILGKKIIEIT